MRLVSSAISGHVMLYVLTFLIFILTIPSAINLVHHGKNNFVSFGLIYNTFFCPLSIIFRHSTKLKFCKWPWDFSRIFSRELSMINWLKGWSMCTCSFFTIVVRQCMYSDIGWTPSITTHTTRSNINTLMFWHGKTPTRKHPCPNQCDHLGSLLMQEKKIT